MTAIPLGTSDYSRQVPNEARMPVRNRFFESNPVLNENGASLIARPGLKLFASIDPNEKVRGVYSSNGTFGNALFAVIGAALYKVFPDGTNSNLGNFSGQTSSVSFAAVANIGDNPEKLFVADGGGLYCYTENGYAKGTLTATGNVTAADVVRIGSIYYSFTSGSVDTGTPAGTLANPWLVLRGASQAASIQNLFWAINAAGTPGTTYSTALVANTQAFASFYSSNTIIVVAKAAGTAGNAIATTETSATLSWAAATLTGGGSASLFQVPLPDDVGAISIAHLNSYVIVIPAQGQGVNGRFYWIEPGEVTIDPLNFATAERSPDAISQVVVFSDMFWLCGQTTTEPWIFTGNPNNPVQRFSGILFDRGTWEGTAVQVKDSLVLTDQDGAVFQIKGGLKRISTPDIEERIRRAIAYENLRNG